MQASTCVCTHTHTHTHKHTHIQTHTHTSSSLCGHSSSRPSSPTSCREWIDDCGRVTSKCFYHWTTTIHTPTKSNSPRVHSASYLHPAVLAGSALTPVERHKRSPFYNCATRNTPTHETNLIFTVRVFFVLKVRWRLGKSVMCEVLLPCTSPSDNVPHPHTKHTSSLLRKHWTQKQAQEESCACRCDSASNFADVCGTQSKVSDKNYDLKPIFYDQTISQRSQWKIAHSVSHCKHCRKLAQ